MKIPKWAHKNFKNEQMHGIQYATHNDMKATSFEYVEVLRYIRKQQH